MRKTIIGEFFTTLSFSHFVNSIYYLTFGLAFLRSGKNIIRLEQKFLDYLEAPSSQLLSFYNGRSALYHALRIIGIKKGDEVLVNAYTCISVINSIIAANATPIYVDIDSHNLSFNIEDLKKKISPKTKAIILQHTFGKTGAIKECLDLASRKNIPVIEDAAHSLGTIYKGIKSGREGDFAIFSTGRDKVISGVNGGFLLINNPKYFVSALSLESVPRLLVAKNLMYNISGYLSLNTYDFLGLGKIIIHLSRKLSLINEIISPEEKRCRERHLYYALPNSLARLAYNDLMKIQEYKEKRKKIAELYDDNLSFKYYYAPLKEEKDEDMNYFRYPIIFENKDIAKEYYEYMRKNSVLIGNSWSGTNIVPASSSIETSKYQFDAKEANKIGLCILLLPNSKITSEKDARKIIELTNNFIPTCYIT